MFVYVWEDNNKAKGGTGCQFEREKRSKKEGLRCGNAGFIWRSMLRVAVGLWFTR